MRDSRGAREFSGAFMPACFSDRTSTGNFAFTTRKDASAAEGDDLVLCADFSSVRPVGGGLCDAGWQRVL